MALNEPPRESHRLALLKRYEILDTPPETAFDRITALAADLFEAPIAIVSIPDGHRLWFKSHHGLDRTEVPATDATGNSSTESLIRSELGMDFFVSAPLVTHDGHELGLLCVIDHRPRTADGRQLRHLATLAALVMDRMELRLTARSAATRAEFLAREVDHRAMNSLQLVASLLNLQSRVTQAPETAQQLIVASNRVLAVARVHRNFSAEDAIDRVPILAYLRRLCGELAEVLDVAIEVDGTESSVPATQVLAIGLIVNELTTNAKKHGAGPISVTFSPGAAGHHELRVFDQGDGLPLEFAASRVQGRGIGIKVVTVLTEQLGGRLSTGANPAGQGACFTVSFPSSAEPPSASPRHLG